MRIEEKSTFVRVVTMALAGAVLLAGTALTYEAPRRAAQEPEPTLARLSASAMRSVSRKLFARDHMPGTKRVACDGHHSDA
jgi:hypothetical protein